VVTQSADLDFAGLVGPGPGGGTHFSHTCGTDPSCGKFDLTASSYENSNASLATGCYSAIEYTEQAVGVGVSIFQGLSYFSRLTSFCLVLSFLVALEQGLKGGIVLAWFRSDGALSSQVEDFWGKWRISRGWSCYD